MTGHFRRHPYLLLLFVLLAAYVAVPAALGCVYEIGFDVTDAIVYPLWQGRLLRAGHVALWNPWTDAGVPHAAALVGTVFSPLTYLTALSESGWSLALLEGAHLLLGAAGMYFYLLRLHTRGGRGQARWFAAFGATAFLMSGWLMVHRWAGHPTMIRAAAFVPWGLWGLETPGRRGAAALGLAGGLTILSGAQDLLLFIPVLWTFYALLRPKTRWSVLLGGGLLALAVGLPQLVATIDFLPRTSRIELVRSADYATVYDLPPQHLAALVVPGAFGWFPSATYYGAASFPEVWAYPGIIVLLTAGAAVRGGARRETLFFLLCAGFSLLCALGDATPFYPALLKGFPLAGLFRRPNRYLFFLAISLPVLASLGAARLRNAPRPRLGGILAAAGAIVWLLQQRIGTQVTELLAHTDAAAAGGADLNFLPLVRSLGVQTVLVGLFFLLPRRPAVLLFLLVLDLAPWAVSLHRPRPLTDYLPAERPALAEGFAPGEPLHDAGRLAVLQMNGWYVGFDVWYEVPTLIGGYSLMPNATARALSAAREAGPSSKTWDRFATRRFLTKDGTRPNPGARPMASLGETPLRFAYGPGPNRISVEFPRPSPAPGTLRLAIAWDPHWLATARPGGYPISLRADRDGLIQAVVPAGTRILTLRYAPSFLSWTLAAQALGGLLALVWLLHRRRAARPLPYLPSEKT